MGLGQRLLALERRLYVALEARATRAEAFRAVRHGRKPRPPHLVTGELGEDHAYLHLLGLGYTVVARRWSSARARGDLDLLAYDGPTLVAVEVKTQTTRGVIPAEAQVDPAKQDLLRRQVRHYLHSIRRTVLNLPTVRFDVLSVYLLPTGTEIDHLPNAFPFRSRARSPLSSLKAHR